MKLFNFEDQKKLTFKIWDWEIFRDDLKGGGVGCDKVCSTKMMTNTGNVESSLLTSNLLKSCSLYNFCYKLHM